MSKSRFCPFADQCDAQVGDTLREHRIVSLDIVSPDDPGQCQQFCIALNDYGPPSRDQEITVRFGKQGTVTLGGKSTLIIEDAVDTEVEHRASYRLQQGTTAVNLSQSNGLDNSIHEISIGEQVLKLRPNTDKASVEFRFDGQTVNAVLRRGTLDLKNGTTFSAGTRISVSKNQEIKAQPLAETKIQLSPKSNSIIHYEESIPPMMFTWSSKTIPAEGYDIELATDRDFSNTILRERLPKPRFVFDRIAPGRFFWRVLADGEWVRGTFKVTRLQGSQGCTKCKRTNIINDTGEKTVVYFQKALPAITFKWKQVAGAVSYRLKVFVDGKFEKPKIDQVVTTTSLGTNAGTLPEGKYFWLVVALDAQNGELPTGKMNNLEIAYDNAVPNLVIKSPSQGIKLSQNSLLTQGEVQLGASLMINGKRIRLDSKGRFSHSLKLSRGNNRLVYRTLARDGIERYYTREVIRR